MSLQEDSLRDSGVLNAALNDVNSIVIKVVVYDALADSIVLRCVFDNWLLEVGLEVENLKKLQLESVIKFEVPTHYNIK